MHEMLRKSAGALLISLGVLATAAPTYAQPIAYSAHLTAANEIPPAFSKGIGEGTFTFDPATKVMTWTITYSGLTGPVAAARLEPSMISSSFPDEVSFTALASPIKGQATLTDAQIQDLLAGRLYVNVHTDQYPEGEIRGQIVKQG